LGDNDIREIVHAIKTNFTLKILLFCPAVDTESDENFMCSLSYRHLQMVLQAYLTTLRLTPIKLDFDLQLHVRTRYTHTEEFFQSCARELRHYVPDTPLVVDKPLRDLVWFHMFDQVALDKWWLSCFTMFMKGATRQERKTNMGHCHMRLLLEDHCYNICRFLFVNAPSVAAVGTRLKRLESEDFDSSDSSNDSF
jgi:hypothetical protein